MSLVGVVQGRLSKSPKNRLQFFPKKNWKNEFNKAKKIGFDFIEFFSERKFNENNPIWDIKKIEEYIKLSKENNLKILNFCDDYIISHSINKKTTQKYIKKLIKNLKALKVKNFILPLYGKSLLHDNNYLDFIPTFKILLTFEDKLNFFIESNISPEKFLFLKKRIKSNRFKFLFDTGNRINLKRDLYKDMEILFKDIGHIHIKDKNNKNQNVKLGTGLVDFKRVFFILKKRKYNKNFTFETTRGRNPIKMAKFNLLFINKLFKF
jgi:sugar phosphate isomerase/epimerase